MRWLLPELLFRCVHSAAVERGAVFRGTARRRFMEALLQQLISAMQVARYTVAADLRPRLRLIAAEALRVIGLCVLGRVVGADDSMEPEFLTGTEQAGSRRIISATRIPVMAIRILVTTTGL